MNFPNVYTHRKVAEGSAKGCEICFKPTTSVLITPENKVSTLSSFYCLHILMVQDFFYICPNHLKDRGFATPIVDKAAEEAKKKKAAEEKEAKIKEEMERVKKEYEEKQKKKKDKKDKKDDEKDKEKDEKDKDKKDKKDDEKEKDKDSKDDKDKDEVSGGDTKNDDCCTTDANIIQKDKTPESDEPRVFALNK